MTNIHIKIEHGEAIDAKRDILLAQKEILGLIKHIRGYNLLRAKEYSLKNKLKRELSGIRVGITKVESDFPKSEAMVFKRVGKAKKMEKLEAGEQEQARLPEKKTKLKEKTQKVKRDEIEDELMDIQEKLARLQ